MRSTPFIDLIYVEIVGCEEKRERQREVSRKRAKGGEWDNGETG